MSVHASIKFYWRDIWIGLYKPKSWGTPWVRTHEFYVCLIPMFPIHITVTIGKP